MATPGYANSATHSLAEVPSEIDLVEGTLLLSRRHFANPTTEDAKTGATSRMVQ